MRSPHAAAGDLPRYDAFATYATDPDRDLVRDVETFVEGLHRDRLMPKEFRTALAMCVDGHDFQIPRPGPGTSRTIDDLMHDVVCAYQAASRCLVVFTGERSRGHRWINDEIRWWRKRPDAGPIYLAITHGQLHVGPYDQFNLQNVTPLALQDSDASVSPIWFDLRGYYSRRAWPRTLGRKLEREVRRDSGTWIKVRDYEEERFRLAAQILAHRVEKTLSQEDLIPAWQAAFRLKRRVRRTVIGSAVAAIAIAAAVTDRLVQERKVVGLTDTAQRLIDDHQYERAIEVGLRGLPLDGDLLWRSGWDAPEVRKLLAVLAGAAQLAPQVAQLKTGEKAPIQSVAFDAGGEKLVAASQAGTATVSDNNTRAKAATCRQDDAFRGHTPKNARGSTEWVRDSRFRQGDGAVVSVGRYGAWIWDPKCPSCNPDTRDNHCSTLVRIIGHNKDVRTATFSPDGMSLVTTSDDGTARVWNAATGAESVTLELPTSRLPSDYSYTTSADFSPDGKLIVVSRRDGLIAIADATSGEMRRTLQTSGASVWSVRFDREGNRIVSASGSGEAVVWELSSGAKIPLPRQLRGITSAEFSRDGRFIVTSSADGTARVWDATKLSEALILKGHEGPVLSAAFSPDGKRIATSSDDQTARLWSTGAIPSVVHSADYGIEAAAMSTDGKRFVVGTFDGRIILYAIGEDYGLTPIGQIPADVGEITSVAFGDAAEIVLFAAANGAVKLWNTRSGKVEALAPLPAGRTFVSTTRDANLIATASSGDAGGLPNRVSNRQSGESHPLQDSNRLKSIELSPDATRVAAASDEVRGGKRIALVWDSATGKQLLQLKHDDFVLSAHFARDGKRLVTTSLDRKAHVWDATTGNELQTFVGHMYDVNSARFSPDGGRVVTASSDRTAVVWHVETGTAILKLAPGVDARDAFFTADGTHIFVTTADGNIVVYDVTWTAAINRDLKRRLCSDRFPTIVNTDACTGAGPLSFRHLWTRALGAIARRP